MSWWSWGGCVGTHNPAAACRVAATVVFASHRGNWRGAIRLVAGVDEGRGVWVHCAMLKVW